MQRGIEAAFAFTLSKQIELRPGLLGPFSRSLPFFRTSPFAFLFFVLARIFHRCEVLVWIEGFVGELCLVWFFVEIEGQVPLSPKLSQPLLGLFLGQLVSRRSLEESVRNNAW